MAHLPTHSLIIMVLILLLLLLGSLITAIKIKKHPETDYSELKQRVTSWWWMIGILYVAFVFDFIIICLALISFLALKEFFSIVPLRHADRNAVFWVYLSIPIQYYWIATGWYTMSLIFIPVYLFLFIPMRMVIIGETAGFIRSAATLHWGAMLSVFSLSHLAMLSQLKDVRVDAGGLGLVLLALLLTQFNDVMQYVCGKTFGKRKIIPKVSPGKTWEGFIGGMLCTTVFAMCLGPFLSVMTVGNSLIAGLLIAIAGFFGDVVLSSVKRDLAIKDSGHLIPGHGGILDRMDSLTFAAPIFFHYYYYYFEATTCNAL
ncbi:MAG: phosphatidate cytidylyltransferase [Gammaproteobacteria bacterium]|nr:MAG: phosphatidate cytidylyltransferase [Gammaproteobacteria bacterium]